jgi:hypothetical protein
MDEGSPSGGLARPFDRGWASTELRGLAVRHRAGEPAARLHEELLTRLWPWAAAQADRLAARLPAGADADALRGEVLAEVYQAVRRIDWERWDRWPGLLRARMRCAVSTAARAEDTLSRGERQARRAYLAAEEAATQRLGRSLTYPERDRLARGLGPRGSAGAVLGGRRLERAGDGPRDGASGGGRADAVRGRGPSNTGAADHTVTLSEFEVTPEASVVREQTARGVRDWVRFDLPPRLGARMQELLDGGGGRTTVPGPVRRSLEPFLPGLLHRIGPWP